MGFKGKSYVVPDPTILLGNILFSKLGAKKFIKAVIIFAYMFCENGYH